MRTSRLFDRISDCGATSYLSGILIGNDVRSALATNDEDSATIIGDGQLARCYALAMSGLGVSPRIDARPARRENFLPHPAGAPPGHPPAGLLPSPGPCAHAPAHA